MNLFLILIEITLQIFTSWTLAYHFLLLTRLPAKFIIIPFLVILCSMMALFGLNWKYSIRHLKSEVWFLISGAGLALAAGSFTLFNSRPDADDFNFFHRPLTQLQDLALPFILTDTGHNVSDLPPISVLHVMTAYEPLVAIAAALLGADPLTIYQNLGAFLSGIIMTIVYILL